MSSRPKFGPYPVFGTPTHPTASMATSQTSLITIIDNMSMFSYGVSWSGGGTPVGALSVQVSNDYSVNSEGTVLNPGTWNTIPFQDSSGTIVTSVAVTGNTGNGFINVDGQAGYAVRLIYTATSGTGLISAFAHGKVA